MVTMQSDETLNIYHERIHIDIDMLLQTCRQLFMSCPHYSINLFWVWVLSNVPGLSYYAELVDNALRLCYIGYLTQAERYINLEQALK